MSELRKKQVNFFEDKTENKDTYERVFEMLEKKDQLNHQETDTDKLDKEIALLQKRLKDLRGGVILKTRKTEEEVN